MARDTRARFVRARMQHTYANIYIVTNPLYETRETRHFRHCNVSYASGFQNFRNSRRGKYVGMYSIIPPTITANICMCRFCAKWYNGNYIVTNYFVTANASSKIRSTYNIVTGESTVVVLSPWRSHFRVGTLECVHLQKFIPFRRVYFFTDEPTGRGGAQRWKPRETNSSSFSGNSYIWLFITRTTY